MESSKQNTTKTASPAATIISRPLLIYRQSNPGAIDAKRRISSTRALVLWPADIVSFPGNHSLTVVARCEGVGANQQFLGEVQNHAVKELVL